MRHHDFTANARTAFGRHVSRSVGALIGGIVLVGFAPGCGGSDDDSSGASGGSATGGSGASQASGTPGSGGNTVSGGGNTSSPSNNACGLGEGSTNSSGSPQGASVTQFEACAAESREAEAIAADIFIMLDQSVSMGEHTVPPLTSNAPTRWEVITRALQDFIASPNAAGLRVGIQYFGLGEYGEVSCDAEDYAVADVPIGALPDNASALLASIDAHAPSNFTPSVPALEGALLHAKRWAMEHPGRPTVVVFATDGYPTECERRSIADLVEVARAYANPTDGSPRVPTFVLGLGEIPNLEAVAKAGGTGEAFFVGDCPTAVEDLKTSLERVAASPALCEFELPRPPEGEFLDTNQVNMVFTPSSTGEPEVVHKVAGGNCANGGWYYNNDAQPERVYVCPATCGRFGGGIVDLVVGCETVSLK